MKVLKKWLASFIALAMTLTLMSVNAFAKEETTKQWSGEVATAFQSGDGSKDSPFEIANAEQFAYFAQQISKAKNTEAYYSLTANIDLSSQNWNPITFRFDDYNEGKAFFGNFEGNHHTITYRIEQSNPLTAYDGLGLFGTSEGNFSNLQVSGDIIVHGEVTAGNIGGLVALGTGTFQNCLSDVNIFLTNSSNTNRVNIGGIVGKMQGGTILNSCYSGEIQALQKNASGSMTYGGIVGILCAADGKISQCQNTGTIHVSRTFGYTGGIAGMVATQGYSAHLYIENSYNLGSIDAVNSIGGIVGYLGREEDEDAEAKILNCYSLGIVKDDENPEAKAICSYIQIDEQETSGRVAIENCYYINGSDEYGIQVNNTEELYQKISQSSQGMWKLDNDGNIRLYWEFADYSQINELLTKVPDDLSVYTDESIQALKKAQDQIVDNLLRSQQEKVDEYAQALKEALETLEYQPADYSQVDAIIEKAESLNKDNYKDFSKVEEAIKAVDRNKNITQQKEVDGYVQSIEQAIKELEYQPADYSQVDAIIEKAESLNKDDYKDFSKVEEAIKAVDINKNITQQKEVDQMAKDIENAILQLEKKAISVEPTQPQQKPHIDSTIDSTDVSHSQSSSIKNEPQTYDVSQPYFWGGMLALSLMGIIGYVFIQRKQ